MENLQIRKVQLEDNPILAKIIRETLSEYGANKPGTVFGDPLTDQLFQFFQQPDAVYLVAILDGHLIGGAGIFPLEGADATICELQKMYLLPYARGRGIGSHLLTQCLEFAQLSGYTQCYLESMPELKEALKVYEQFDFKYLDAPLGNTGHFDCTIWMMKTLGENSI
ncbi:MAG: GNAT family N-acetyltransferase [Chitinophagaceae bacterium]